MFNNDTGKSLHNGQDVKWRRRKFKRWRERKKMSEFLLFNDTQTVYIKYLLSIYVLPSFFSKMCNTLFRQAPTGRIVSKFYIFI